MAASLSGDWDRHGALCAIFGRNRSLWFWQNFVHRSNNHEHGKCDEEKVYNGLNEGAYFDDNSRV